MSNSDKEKAISAFRKHKAKINQGNMSQWLAYAVDITEKYIGPTTQLRHAWIGLLRHGDPNLTQKSYTLIDQCIDAIEDNGVYKPNNYNYLMGLKNGELTLLLSTIIIGAMGLAWGLGIGYNQLRIDKISGENLQLETSLKKIESKLDSTKKKLDTYKKEASKSLKIFPHDSVVSSSLNR